MDTTIKKAISTLQDLIAIDTVQSTPSEGAPFGMGNRKALDYTLDLLAKNGFFTHDVRGYCGWGEIGEGELFGILFHLDVVPISGVWKHDAFSAVIDNGELFGRGALDDKGPGICCIYATLKLLEEGYKPKRRIRFIFGCNEESGWKCMEEYQKTEEMPVLGFSPDADFPVINCEKGVVYHSFSCPIPNGVISIDAGQRPNMVPDYARAVVTGEICNKISSSELTINALKDGNYEVISYGIGAHGSTPSEGKNALIALLSALSFTSTDFVKITNAFSDNCGANINLNLTDKESGALTLNLGVCRTENNTINFELDVRHPITYTKEDVTRILNTELPYEFIQGSYHLPLYVSPDNELVTSLMSAYQEVTNDLTPPITIGGGTYARMLPLGVAFGPIFPWQKSTIHQPNERISISDFELMFKVYYQAIKKLCF